MKILLKHPHAQVSFSKACFSYLPTPHTGLKNEEIAELIKNHHSFSYPHLSFNPLSGNSLY